MELLNTITVDHINEDVRHIKLYSGLLITESAELTTDYLLISSNPGDYDPAQGGFVAELYAIGVSVKALESTCEADFRPLLPCWISRVQQGRFFKRLVVFEPGQGPDQAARSAWQVFQALQQFAGSDGPATLALGILNGHDEILDAQVMLRVSVLAAASLAARAPWPNINVVVPATVADSLALEFETLKARYINPPIAPEALLRMVAEIKKAWPHFDQPLLTPAASPEEVGLTARQYNMVRQYTIVLYYYLNGILRGGEVSSPEYAYFHPTIEALSTGLAQMKKFRVTQTPVYRYVGAFPGIEDLYKVGAIAREAAYTSTSRRSHIWNGDYRLAINSAIGKDIDILSNYPEEDEVLFDFDMHHAIYTVEAPVAPEKEIRVGSHEMLPNTTDIYASHL